MEDSVSEQPFDRDEALSRLGGDEAFLAEVAALFAEDAPRLLVEMKAALASGDAAGVRRAAHGMRGALGYLGGGPAEAAAGRLERLGAAGELGGGPEALSRLQVEVTRLADALAAAGLCEPIRQRNPACLP